MTWNNLIKKYGPESGAFLQTLEWGAFQTTIGRTVFYIASANGQVQTLDLKQAEQAQKIDGLALAIFMPISFGKKFLYIPRGPIGNNAEEIIELATKIARQEKAIFVKIEPITQIQNSKFKIQNSFTLQPEKTVILDLTKTSVELLAAMHTKTRYNIALARRHNVRVERWNNSEIATSSRQGEMPRNDMFNQWFKLMDVTARRDDFHAHPKNYYQELLNINGEMKTALWLAFDGDDLLAGNLMGYFNHTATYLHGASSNTKRNLMAPFLLHWEIILDAQTNGFTAYDFWGVDEKKWPGITRFKRNFGNEKTLHEVAYPKAMDIPINRFWHFLYCLTRTLKH